MKILIGGSPCTHWSIAQTKNRETEASGIGWELFLNYRIARDKYHPDYFLYENNKSMSPAIRAQITAVPGVWVHREFRGGRADGKRLALLPRLRAGDHRGSGQSVSVRQ